MVQDTRLSISQYGFDSRIPYIKKEIYKNQKFWYTIEVEKSSILLIRIFTLRSLAMISER